MLIFFLQLLVTRIFSVRVDQLRTLRNKIPFMLMIDFFFVNCNRLAFGSSTCKWTGRHIFTVYILILSSLHDRPALLDPHLFQHYSGSYVVVSHYSV